MIVSAALLATAAYGTVRTLRLLKSARARPTADRGAASDAPSVPGADASASGTADRQPEQDAFARLLDRVFDDVAARIPDRWSVGAERRESLDRIMGEAGVIEIERSPQERRVNRDIVLSSATLAASSVGTVLYPPALLLTVPGLSYRLVQVARQARTDWREERRVKDAFGRMVFHVALIATRQVWTLTMFQCIYSYIDKVLTLTYDDSRTALADVFGNLPRTAWVVRDGVEVEIPLTDVARGDHVSVRAGGTVPCDGTVVSGVVLVDQHTLTGEQEPVEAHVGDAVFAGTLVVTGHARFVVEKMGDESLQARIAAVLDSTVDYRTGAQLFCERVVDQSTLPTLGVGAATLALLGPTAAVASISCGIGYQMRATGPLAVQNYLRWIAEEGILVKDGRALERAGDINVVVFDKTGTLTEPTPRVHATHALDSLSADEVLRLAASAEFRQSHPIADAICDAAADAGLALSDCLSVDCVVGHGIRAAIDGVGAVIVGSERFLTGEGVDVDPEATRFAGGRTVVHVAVGERLVGAIELAARTRPEARSAIRALQAEGIEVLIVSGDHENATRRLAEHLGVDGYHARVLPQQKAEIIDALQQDDRRVCFVGDGINDAIALKVAHVSMSMRGATTMALDSAHVVLVDGDLMKVPAFLRLSGEFGATMDRNLLSSIVPYGVNLLGVYALGTGAVVGAAISWAGLAIGTGNSCVRPPSTADGEAEPGADKPETPPIEQAVTA